MSNDPQIMDAVWTAVLGQLQVCLKNLDFLGASIAAAHVDTAIQSLKIEYSVTDVPDSVNLAPHTDFTILDEMAEKYFS